MSGTVERRQGERSRRRVQRIVVGVDGSRASDRALAWAAALARRTGAEVVAVHALHPPWGLGLEPLSDAPFGEELAMAVKEWRESIEHTVAEEWCARVRGTGVAVSTLVVDGGPAALLALARRLGAVVVVVGRSGRSGLAEALLGSFSHHVVHHSPVPVLVVPAGRER